MRVELDNLTKRWGPVAGADGITLSIGDGEFVAFLGPSGCGKTTTLLMVAGIYRPTEGEIRFDGYVVNDVAPKDRNVGMVFQSYALYPHMSVFENITYPLKIQKVSKEETQRRAREVADVMGIGELMDRKPGQLSGGQQQRVALGRALVKEPQLLLFDEPLSNLDARLRITMRGEIKRLQRELGITSIYVTHDQVEAMTMADRIAVMKEGKLQAYSTPDEIYDRPKTLFVAGFVGNPPMNFLHVEVVPQDGVFRARRPDLDLVVPREQGEKAAGRGQVVMGIRPEDITLGTGDLTGEVMIVEPLGRENLVDVKVGDVRLHVLASAGSGIAIGDKVSLRLDTAKAQFFDPDSEQSLLWS
jgi:ABC-type sugar transport system ATPase subunit